MHRGRNLRLNSQDLLRYGIRLQESRPFEQQPRACRCTYRKLLPISVVGSESLTPNHCISLVKQQLRTAPQRIGLHLRHSRLVPAGYALCDSPGEMQADSRQHAINGAPTWLRRASTQMAYQDAPHGAWVCRGWPSTLKPYVGGEVPFSP